MGELWAAQVNYDYERSEFVGVFTSREKAVRAWLESKVTYGDDLTVIPVTLNKDVIYSHDDGRETLSREQARKELGAK